MSSAINPEAASPTSTLAFEQSDRNPVVGNWGEGGGQLQAPSASASRITLPGATPSANAGLLNYDTENSEDAAENEAERES